MIHVDISTDLEAQLLDISKRTGRSVEDHVRQAVADYLADLPDLELFRQRRAEVASGDTITMSEMKARLGLVD